jgi:hypothetical protein
VLNGQAAVCTAGLSIWKKNSEGSQNGNKATNHVAWFACDQEFFPPMHLGDISQPDWSATKIERAKG